MRCSLLYYFEQYQENNCNNSEDEYAAIVVVLLWRAVTRKSQLMIITLIDYRCFVFPSTAVGKYFKFIKQPMLKLSSLLMTVSTIRTVFMLECHAFKQKGNQNNFSAFMRNIH